jgi:hypothetical protein
MKKILLIVSVVIIFLSSCEVEYRGGYRYNHFRGYEYRHYPYHHDVYDHGYHHDEHGGELHGHEGPVDHPRR